MNATRLLNSALQVNDLHVYYGQSHVLQGVNLAVPHNGILSVVGRNGMGKTTLCKAIMGLLQPSDGSIIINGTNVHGLDTYKISDLSIAYVPQGRRVWPSLTVDEHLRLAAKNGSAWTQQRIYSTFPQLAERRSNGGNQLSGGEQQMLAIGRALLRNPSLLIMDEPTEGLAPIIVAQVEALLRSLAEDEGIAVLLIEQNLGVAMRASKRIAIMVNGRIETELDTEDLKRDKALQKQLLGVADNATKHQVVRSNSAANDAATQAMQVADTIEYDASALNQAQTKPNRFTHGNPLVQPKKPDHPVTIGRSKSVTYWNRVTQPASPIADSSVVNSEDSSPSQNRVYVVGTFDTKHRELLFVRNLLIKKGLKTITVDLSTSNQVSTADISPFVVAQSHPNGSDAVFTGDRGTAVAAMAAAFTVFLSSCTDVDGIISLGGSGGTALATPAMQQLQIGVPKLMVSTVASGDVGAYVGAADINMMYSVTDVSGINRISEKVLSNAANAIAGMVLSEVAYTQSHKLAIGLSMFGVTTPCVQLLTKKLDYKFDCVVFHATGTGGQSMEKLVESGELSGLLDVTTTEVADLLVGGIMCADEDRFGAVIRTGIPYVGSCGALDMVNFGALDTVPTEFKNRNLYVHNGQVTLMRTTVEENQRIGEWIGTKLNLCNGPVRFLIPAGGLSTLDATGQVFHDPQANAALFAALERVVKQTQMRQLVRLPYHINDPAFAAALASNFNEIMHS